MNRRGFFTRIAHLAEDPQKVRARRVAEPENNPFLDRFYQAEPGMGFATQLWFLMERFEQMCQLRDKTRSRPCGRAEQPTRTSDHHESAN